MPVPEPAIATVVGERLRGARTRRGLSIASLAAAAGVGKGSLSEIENGARNATLGTLYSLAGALDVPLATLLAERIGSEVRAPGFAATLLDVSRDGGSTVEVYRLRLDTACRHVSGAHGPGVTEHLLLTAGRARVGRAGAEVELGPGEAADWLSDGPHGYTALGDAGAGAVLVIRSPDGSGQ